MMKWKRFILTKSLLFKLLVLLKVIPITVR